MKKISVIINCLLIIVCLILVGITFKTKASYANTNSQEINTNTMTNNSDFDALNYKNSFDVSDFANFKTNTIDITSLQYTNNTISIADTDFKLSDDLTSSIYDTINNYGASSSFYIVDLNNGMSVGYNVDRHYETASSIKAPYALYIYEEIAKGNINPNQEITYTSQHYNQGTGIIKNSNFETNYTVRDLVYYSLTESDNIAHIMLHSKFGVKGYNEMLRNLGTKELYLTAGNPWGYTSCRSAALIWQEIYNFSLKDNEGITFLNILANAKYNYFKEVMPSIPSASKAGFASLDVVTTGIVFDKTPYIAIAIANKGGKIGAYTQVLKLINHMNDIMNEYNTFIDNKNS